MTKSPLLVPLFLALLCCANCKNNDAPQCGDQMEGANTHTLAPLPPALTRIEYHADPLADAVTEASEFALLDAPSWLSIDAQTGQLSGIPSDIDAHAERPLRIAHCSDQSTSIWEGSFRTEDNAKYRDPEGYDAYAKDYDGNERTLRNDLEGTLRAEVQFLQSHSSAPDERDTINEADQTQSRYMPAITAQREALLLVLPEDHDAIETLDVRIVMDGEQVEQHRMQHPNTLPAADNPTPWNVRYSAKAWWFVLPYDLLREGLSLEFIVNRNTDDEQQGTLHANRLNFSPASQLVMRTLRLGMLIEPRQYEGHFSLNDPVLAATDYFQTLPVSKLIFSSYADVTLDRVMVQSGVIYDLAHDEASASPGGIYGGDMRENVAKAQVSTGINLANIGVSSHDMRQNYPHGFKQITSHHAWGMYTNDVDGTLKATCVYHGLSGGNGIGTIQSSRTNEASHEWGHAYGLGHYPGQSLTEDGRWADHHADSGWGYIQHRQRLRTGITGVKDGALTYNRDAMSGGYDYSPFSVYTYYTGFSARLIQQDIAQFPIPSSDSPTGYKTWDATVGAYTPYESDLRTPDAVGVPVATLLGAYDPDNDTAVIYPVFHGNHGNVFTLPGPNLDQDGDVCWLDVEHEDGARERIELAAHRHQENAPNQFHVNLDADKRPVHAALQCKKEDQEITLDTRDFDGKIPELPPVAIIGEEHRIQQLQERELKEIQSATENLTPQDALMLPRDLGVKIAGLSDEQLLDHLSEDAWAVVSEYLAIERHAQNIEALLNFGLHYELPTQEFQTQLNESLEAANFLSASQDLDVQGEALTLGDIFVSHSPNEDGYIQALPYSDEDSSLDRWTLDAQGNPPRTRTLAMPHAHL